MGSRACALGSCAELSRPAVPPLTHLGLLVVQAHHVVQQVLGRGAVPVIRPKQVAIPEWGGLRLGGEMAAWSPTPTPLLRPRLLCALCPPTAGIRAHQTAALGSAAARCRCPAAAPPASRPGARGGGGGSLGVLQAACQLGVLQAACQPAIPAASQVGTGQRPAIHHTAAGCHRTRGPSRPRRATQTHPHLEV